MAENSSIEWTDHTFNPWIGCTKVSPACDHCYAERWAKRTGNDALWAGQRRRTTPANWRKPLSWDRKAGELGVRHRVFCASLADVFDNAVPEGWRSDLFWLIRKTPNLDWLLLTKRIGNARSRLPFNWLKNPPANVWIGATVVNQDEADRDIPKLLAVPAAVRFLSCEPLLGPIGFEQIVDDCVIDMLGGEWVPESEPPVSWARTGLDWVIVGGESGPHARRMDIEWCEQIADQCREAGVAFFMKQGSEANWPNWKDFGHWPASLQVRQFPKEGNGQ